MSSEANQNRAGSPGTAASRTTTQAERGESVPAGTGELQRTRPAPGPAPGANVVALRTELGTTRISDGVVAKVAALACRDIPGVFSMGTGMARRVGQIRSLIPGGGESATAQGVTVEVGEREAAIDLDIVTWYGQSIVEISEAVRRNVAGQVEAMTGLRVVEVNINVDDIHVETQGGESAQRVQ